MSEPTDTTTQQGLSHLSSSAEVGYAPTSPIRLRVRRRRLGVTAAVGAVAAVTAAAAVLTQRPWATDPSPAGTTPSSLESAESVSTSDDPALDLEAACGKDARREGRCPIGPVGEELWTQVVEAFDHTLADPSLSEVGMEEGGVHYLFTAHIGNEVVTHPTFPSPLTQPNDTKPNLRVAVIVPATSLPSSPTISISSDDRDNEDFRLGLGRLTITRSNGTVIDMRFWGATPTTPNPASPGTLDVPQLFLDAARDLEH